MLDVKKLTKIENPFRLLSITIFIVLMLYIILFEFILPINIFIPKPSILLESFVSLFTEYNFLDNLFITASSVYTGIFIGYLVIHFFRKLFINLIINYNKFFYEFLLFKYFPPIVFFIIFLLWFDISILIEILFVMIASIILLIKEFYSSIPMVKNEYLDSANSLVDNDNLQSEIIFKSVQPDLIKSLSSIHYLMWSLIMLLELLANQIGLGNILRTAFLYKDISAVFALSIYISLIMLLGNFLISQVSKKVIYWEA